LPRQVFLVFAGRSAATTIGFPFVFIRPAGCKLTSTNKTPAQMASSLATFDLNVPVPEAEEGNAGLDLNEPVLEDDNDIGKFASLLPCFLIEPVLEDDNVFF